MKKIICQHCDQSFESDNRDEVLKSIYGHYMEIHPDVIPNASDEEKKNWMVRFEKEWSEA